MADDADKTDHNIEQLTQAAIWQARSAPMLKPNGKCHSSSCGECVPDKLRFCGPQCRDDFQAEEDAMKRAGRR
jgi:hypothetical protein